MRAMFSFRSQSQLLKKKKNITTNKRWKPQYQRRFSSVAEHALRKREVVDSIPTVGCINFHTSNLEYCTDFRKFWGISFLILVQINWDYAGSTELEELDRFPHLWARFVTFYPRHNVEPAEQKKFQVSGPSVSMVNMRDELKIGRKKSVIFVAGLAQW